MTKAEQLRALDYLEHIIEAIRRINYYTDDMIELTFLDDTFTQDAVIRNFEIIGEACRNIDRHYPQFSETYPEVPLGFAYEMRNALAHGYFKVDLEIIWKTIENDLPTLEIQIKNIYQKLLGEDKQA